MFHKTCEISKSWWGGLTSRFTVFRWFHFQIKLKSKPICFTLNGSQNCGEVKKIIFTNYNKNPKRRFLNIEIQLSHNFKSARWVTPPLPIFLVDAFDNILQWLFSSAFGCSLWNQFCVLCVTFTLIWEAFSADSILYGHFLPIFGKCSVPHPNSRTLPLAFL